MPGEYKLLDATSTPSASNFSLYIPDYTGVVKTLIFKADGVYLDLKQGGTVILVR